MTILEEDCLDKDISITSLEPALKIQNFYVHQYHDVTTLGVKSGRAQYEKGQQDGEDGKGKMGGEDGKGKMGGEDRENKRSRVGYWGNKINLVVRENSSSEASIYHHIIYKY